MDETMPSPHPMWDTALGRYRAFRESHDLRESYRHEECRLLAQMREAFASTRSPFDLEEGQVLAFFLQLKTTHTLSTGSRKNYAIALRGFLKYLGAPAQRWIPRFPKAPPRDEGRYLEAEERAALWAACSTPEDEVILALGLGQGWRRSDLIGCRLADFAPSADRPETVKMHGKGEKFYGVTLELHPKVREVLPRYLTWRAAQLAHASAIFRLTPFDPLSLMIAVSHRDGIGSMCDSTFEKRINAIYARASLETDEWPSHNLRRTWAENRLQAVMEEFSKTHNSVEALELALRVVMREGRWKSVETLRRYLVRRVMAVSSSLSKTVV